MTFVLCLFVTIAILTAGVVASQDFGGLLRLRTGPVLLAYATLLLLLSLSSRGMWYHADTYLGDLWTAHEALHKTAQGLRSSVDYFSPVGPAMQWVYALTLLVRAPGSGSIVLANALVGALALILSVVLLRHRASMLTVGIVGLVSVTVALSPRDIDSLVTAAQSSWLAPYNRWGWSVLLPVLMHAALPQRRSDLAASVLAGTATALLLLLKLTYGAAAIGIYLLAMVLKRGRWHDTATTIGSCLLFIVLSDVVTGGQIRAYAHDLVLAGQMPLNGVRAAKFLAELPVFFAWGCGSLLWLLMARDERDRPEGTIAKHWRAIVLALATGGVGLIVLMQNHYSTEPPTLLLMPLIMAEWADLITAPRVGSSAAHLRFAEWLGIVLLVTLALPAIDAGFILAQKAQTMRKRPSPQLAGTEFHDLIVDETLLPDVSGKCGSSTCNDFRRMMSGRDLLRAQCSSYRDRPTLALNFSNPFPALLGSPSPRHAPIWLHEGRSFSQTTHVPAAELFGDIGCVMVARGEPNADALLKIYSADLRNNFKLQGENSDWQLWARPF